MADGRADKVVRVLVVDDQEVVREGLQAILGTAPEIDVVGTAANGAEALDAVRALHPDVVLMDLNMPVMNGVEATAALRGHPGVSVLVLTTYGATEWVLDAVRAGAVGYLLKDTPRERLIEAILGTAAGRSHIDPAVAGDLLASVGAPSVESPPALPVELTDREREVLGCLGRGMSNAAIAAELFLSEGTVRNYVSALLAKLGVQDRTQAAVLAVRRGLA